MKSKLTLILVVLMVAMFAAANAFATIQLNSRSEEMTAYAPCDQAGSIELRFLVSDYNLINDYLATEDYVRIRVTLTGTDIDPGADQPVLCQAISGTADVSGLGLPALGAGQGYIALDDFDVADPETGEVSHYSGAADMEAYVYGKKGRAYFDIYIVGMLDPSGFADELSWLRVGLYQDLIDLGVDEADTTPICVDVHDFGGLSKLTASYNFIPNTLTINSSDNEIGHFVAAEVEVRDIDKKKDCNLGSTKEIEIDCPEGALGQGEKPDDCTLMMHSGYKWVVLDGDFPTSGEVVLTVRTNGAADGDNTQQGVYLDTYNYTNPVVAYNARGTDCGDYYQIGDYPESVYDEDGDPIDELDKDCPYDNTAKAVVDGMDADEISTWGNKLYVKVNYLVDEDEVDVDDEIMVWVEASTKPCGSIASGSLVGATIIECQTETDYCIYFPYVLNGVSPWATGIVLTNMESKPKASDMYATFKLVDSTGASFTYDMDDFSSVVYSVMVDDLVDMAGWSPAAGNCYLQVTANFYLDGYSFLTNGVFGAGTLSRSCCYDACCD